MTAEALKVSKLSVWLKTESGRIKVVDNISFSIKAGESVGLVGESGCGKTMTAYAILGLLPAAQATVQCAAIKVCGKEISTLSAAQRRRILGRDIAMVFQQPGTALDPVFTIGQQVTAVHRRHTSGNRRAARHATLDSLRQVGFHQPEKIFSAYPHQLSGGMRQLAMIAMATVCRPAVVIADEPTTALDSSTRALILQQIERLRTDYQTAVLMVSHDLSVIRRSCQKVMVMYCGRVLESTNCKKLFAHARHPYSAGLVACIPQIGPSRPSEIKAIPGQLPSPSALPNGCHFAPRCSYSEPQCEHSTPQLVHQGSGDGAGIVACFRPL